MAKTQVVKIDIFATDKASPVFQSASNAANALKKSIEGVSKASALKSNWLGSAEKVVKDAAAVRKAAVAAQASALRGSLSSGLGSFPASSGAASAVSYLRAPALERIQQARAEAARASELLRFDSLSYGEKSLERMVANFKALGLNVDTSSKSMQGLSERIQKTAQSAALKQFAADAGLSTKELNRLRKEVLGLEPEGRSFGAMLKENRFALAAWGVAAASAAKIALDAAIRVDRLNKAYTTISGSAPAARQQLEQMYEVTNRLGLEFFSTAEASKNFFAATRGTSLEKESNTIWQSVVTAGSALSLSQVEIEGAFRALGQMVSKGKVMAEELRGQLGEQLPGAFVLAARAMGVTTTELDKMLERGEVLAEELLPKLARELQNTYGEAAIQAANGLQQSMNRVRTEWERFKASVLDSGLVAQNLRRLSNALKSLNDSRQEEKNRRLAEVEMRKAGIKPEGMDFATVPGHGIEVYTEEQIDAWIERQKEKIKKANEELQKSVRETEILSNAHAIENSVLGETLEYQLRDLQKKRSDALEKFDAKIALIKEQNGNLEEAYATRKKIEAKFARDEEELRAKASKKSGTEGPETIQRDYAGEAIAQLTEQQEREAEKAAREQARNLELAAEVMTELEQKSGQYGLSISYTNQLIEQQAKLWLEAGVPQNYVDQLKEIRRLEASREGWAGAMLATQEYYSEATNMAEAYKGVVTNAFGGMEDVIVTACQTGKLSFRDMVNSMIADLMRLMVRQSITGPLASALGQGIGNLFAVPNGYNFTARMNGFSSANPAVDLYAGMLHGGGMAGSSSGPKRLVPSSLFADAPRFHSGTGFVKPGEFPAILKAGERVLNPAETRDYQRRRGEPTVNVNIVNSTGQPAETRTRSDNHGNKTIDVYVGDMAAKQMATPGTTLNRAVSAQTGTRRPAIKR